VKRFLLLLAVVLLLAFALRVYQLTAVPPGLTHDEANHGREALGVLDGVYLFYFPLNYGSEPLYSYTVALSMALFGEGLLALRLVNVFFGVAAIAVTALWAMRAFDRPTALLAAALTAVSFWPLATSRQALRAGMLPFFMATAVWFFWQIVTAPPENARKRWLAPLDLAYLCGLYSAHLPGRPRGLAHVPGFFALPGPDTAADLSPRLETHAGRSDSGRTAGHAHVCLLAPAPGRAHPAGYARWAIAGASLRQFAPDCVQCHRGAAGLYLARLWRPVPGVQHPRRPVFEVVTAVFFLLGLVICLRNWRKPAYAFLLIWFGVGILPSLITGATANTTRNLAALPAVYLLPAVGFVGEARWLSGRFGRRLRPFLVGAALLWLLFAGWVSGRDYFVRWAQSPDVRGAYQVNLVTALNYLAAENTPPPIVMSTVYPGPAHDSSIALVLRPHAADDLHWVDARRALLWPGGGGGYALIPTSTPPDPAFSPFLQPVDWQSLRPDDLDPGFTLYQTFAKPR
jgi:hypothetical protein